MNERTLDAMHRALLLLALVSLAPAQARRVLFVASPPDNHPAGTHEYERTCRRLAHAVEVAAPEVRAEVSLGWPNDAALARADALVMYTAGADRRREDHPLLADPAHLAALEREAARGLGIVTLHWSTIVPNDVGERFLEWTGGHFDHQSGAAANGWASRITHALGHPTLATPEHPVSRGLPAEFSLRDEYYHALRFRPDGDVTPLLEVDLGGPEVVAWCRERANGGRGFGFTGGHFAANYGDANVGRMILNAVLWCAHVEVPATGADVAGAAAIRALVVTGHDHPAHPWGEKTVALREALERDPRYEVTVIEDPEVLGRDALEGVDVVLLNYCNWERPGLSAPARDALLAYVEDGGGLVPVHFANGAFHPSLPGAGDSDWPAYRERLVRRVWDHAPGASGHDAYGSFPVQVTDVAHPITAGLTDWEAQDELYYRQAGDEPIEPLVTARSKDLAREAPLAWAYDVAAGRAFQTVLGHDAASLRVPGTADLIRRGTTWAAGRTISRHVTPVTAADAPGRFGRALDARVRAIAFQPQAAYSEWPLTVDAWVRAEPTGRFEVFVSNQPKDSGGHWELYSYVGDGDLAVYLPGYTPSEIRSGVRVADGAWHFAGFTFDGTEVVLFLDGKEVARQRVERNDLPVRAGPLWVGAAEHPDYRVGCQGQIDELRLSRGVRDLSIAPDGPSESDPATLGLWHFDAEETPTFEPPPAWTPPVHDDRSARPYEKETDADWHDGRFQRMDTGPFLSHSIRTRGVPGVEQVNKGLALRLGEGREGSMLFDMERCVPVAYWTGPFLEISDVRFGLLNKPVMGAKASVAARETWLTGLYGEATKPRWCGLHVDGEPVTLEYEVSGVSIRERPWLERTRQGLVFTRSFTIGPHADSLHLSMRFDWALGGGYGANSTLAQLETDTRRLTVACSLPGALEVSLGTVRVNLAASDSPRTVELALATAKVYPRIGTRPEKTTARRAPTLVTRGELGTGPGPYVVDTLETPDDNPYGALFYLTGIGFLPDGDAVVCTAHGDVWTVSGIDDDLDELTWTRYASGLYQPLGLQVVDGEVIVLGRDRLTRLRDEDGDRVADVYESYNDDLDISGADHAYAMDLERGPDGALYFQKSGGTDTAHGGATIRVAPDGSRLDVVAHGFRHANGIGVSPDGVVTNGDNEGNWIPATRLNWIPPGRDVYGGFQPANRGDGDPNAYSPPLCWLPRYADSSAGGQRWVAGDRWGLPEGTMLHTSFGHCRLFVVPNEAVTVDGETWRQGGAVAFPFTFEAGVCRGRFRPQDGQLYLVGLDGWQTGAVRDGCLQRVRYVGGPVPLPTSVEVREDGLLIGFACDLDPASVRPDAFAVERWNYRYAASYGSEEYSVAEPERVGHDPVTVTGARLLADGRTVFLGLATVEPVMQQEVVWRLHDSQGERVEGTLHHTIHGSGPPFE